MTGLIDTLLSCIATAEGAFVPDSLPATLLNPGDLKFAGQLNATRGVKCKDGTYFAKFTKLEFGIVAGKRQIYLQMAQSDSLRQLISDWAPASDGNQTSLYLTETLRRLKAKGFEIDPDRPLAEYESIERIP